MNSEIKIKSLKGSMMLLFILLLNFSSFGQNDDKNKQTEMDTKTYYYSFDVTNHSDKLEQAQSQIEKVIGVAKVKLNYKAAKSQGQYIITVVEPKRASEKPMDSFSVKMIKDILIENGFTPLELIFE